MDTTYAKDKLAADRIVLLGILILGVLIARMIVSVRSTIEMSGPIKLEFAGLSIAMPSGEGWNCADRWIHSDRLGDNSRTLAGAFTAGQRRRPGTRVVCTCSPALEVVAAKERFEDLARQAEGEIMDAGQIQRGGVSFEWVRISERTGRVNVLCATAVLPYDRQLDITVQENTGDLDWARIVFDHVVDSVRIDEGLLKAGGDLVAGVKARGVGSFLENRNRRRLFAVKNSSGESVGFTVDVFVDMDDEDELPIQAAGALYLKDTDIRDHATSFYAKDDLSQFRWKSRTINMVEGEMVGSSVVDVLLDQSGIIATWSPDAQKREYRAGPLAVPGMLLELFIVQMLEEGTEQCVIDVIEEDGLAVPVIVSQVSAEQARQAAGNDQIEYGVRLDYQYLNVQDYYEIMYLDAEKQVLLEAVKHKDLYFLERADEESVASEFPERAELVLYGDKLKEKLERDRE